MGLLDQGLHVGVSYRLWLKPVGLHGPLALHHLQPGAGRDVVLQARVLLDGHVGGRLAHLAPAPQAAAVHAGGKIHRVPKKAVARVCRAYHICHHRPTVHANLQTDVPACTQKCSLCSCRPGTQGAAFLRERELGGSCRA